MAHRLLPLGMMRKLRLFFLLVLGFIISDLALGCGGCSGNGYQGAYSTGGYNLYTFATDVYTIVDTTYYAAIPSSGVSNISLIGNNLCLNSPSLFGQTIDPNSQLINQLLINQINQNAAQMCMVSGMCNPINPYLPSYGSFPGGPIAIPPVAGIPFSPFYPPIVTPSFPSDPNSPYSPISPYNPFTPSYPPSIPPPNPLPYGGCDNIVVMCPQGPITPPGSPGYSWPQFPNFNYPGWPNNGGTSPVPPPNQNYSGPGTPTTPSIPEVPYSPSYDGSTHDSPQPPIRFELPRGGRPIR